MVQQRASGLRVRFTPMSAEEFSAYQRHAIRDYARFQTRAGLWERRRALQLSRESFARLLIAGKDTPNHHLWTIRNHATTEPVGILWFAVLDQGGRREGFIYDFEVEKEYRRKGFGTAALRALETRARRMKLSSIRLRVHAHNAHAHRLYANLGYEETDIMMARRL